MQKIIHVSLLLILFVGAVFAQSVESAPPTLVGTWIFKMEGDNSPQRVRITADNSSLKGNVYGQNFTPTLKNNQLEFRVGNFQWSGTLQGDQINGEILVDGNRSKWSARRVNINATPKSYDYAPPANGYSLYFASNGAPVLRLNSGATVRTKTVDASGTDENSKRVSAPGNPLTGPFYIENTLPGDVLVIKLKTVQTNRNWAFSGRALLDNVLDADYLRERKFGDIDNTWMIDQASGIVRLKTPPDNLKNFTVPLTPFLGCIGVAPPDGASLRSRASGAFGGNMESRYVRSGSTVYLPVFEEGAYLFLGDGHANQGDGELTGDALETSMNVEFTVEVLESQWNRTPRIETDESLISIGVSGSLDNATRTATSDLARWLEQRYKLTSTETAMIIGFANQYEIADMVPPYLTVLSRIPKKHLIPAAPK